MVPSDGEPLAVLLDRRDAAHDRRDLLHHAAVHRSVGEGEPPELGGLHEAVAHGRLGGDAHAEAALRERTDRAQPRGRVLPADRLDVLVVTSHVWSVPSKSRNTGVGSPCSARISPGSAVRGSVAAATAELRVVELVEEIDRAHSASVTASTPLMRRRGTGARARRPSTPPPRRSRRA